MRRLKWIIFRNATCLLLAGCLSASLALGQEAKQLDSMNLEDLLAMEVSSVSKKADKLQDAATSIYVVTQEDIRRSGSTRLTDVLNLVPGVFFHDVTFNYLGEAIRNASEDYAQTVVLLLDGVPLTSPLTAGMSYNIFDMPLEQIERIEVIKGPGGTVYGANANTGIINIYTKSGKEAPGLQVHIQGGTQDYIAPYISYGGNLSNKVSMTAYGKYLTTRGYDKTSAFSGSMVRPPDGSLSVPNPYTSNDTDGKKAFSFGLNLHSQMNQNLSSTTRFFFNRTTSKTFQTRIDDPYTPGTPVPLAVDEEGTTLVLSQRFDYKRSENHSIFFHTYLNRSSIERGIGGGTAAHSTTVDFELQDNLKFGKNDLAFGGNARIVKFVADDARKDLLFSEPDITKYLYAAFVQDTIHLRPNLDLTVGTKAETWTLIDNQMRLSPSARLSIRPAKGVTFWGAFSKSITTPGYIQTKMEFHQAEIPYITPEMAAGIADQYGLTGSAKEQFIAQNTTSPLFLSGTDKLFVAVVNGEGVKPVEYYTGEFGLRSTLGSKAYIDFSAFYSKFNNGITSDADFRNKLPVYSKVDPNHTIWPIYYDNIYEGHLHGWETVLKTQPIPNIRVEVSHSLFKIVRRGLSIPGRPGEKYNFGGNGIPATPIHVVRLRPYVDFPKAGLYLTLNATWNSEHDPGDKYNYQLLTPASEALGIPGIWQTPPANRWKVDFSVEKTLAAKHWRLNFWGRNVFANPYVEAFTQFAGIGYPHSIHRTFGGGLSYQY
jgi:outer membrane receptor protein involved in Fe transport